MFRFFKNSSHPCVLDKSSIIALEGLTSIQLAISFSNWSAPWRTHSYIPGQLESTKQTGRAIRHLKNTNIEAIFLSSQEGMIPLQIVVLF